MPTRSLPPCTTIWASLSPYRPTQPNSMAGRSSSSRPDGLRTPSVIRSGTSGYETCRKPSDRSTSSSTPPTFSRMLRSAGRRRQSTRPLPLYPLSEASPPEAAEPPAPPERSDSPSERVRLAVTQVVDPVLQSRGAYLLLEVGERRGEDVIVVVMDGDGEGGIDNPHRLHPLLRVHADQDPQHPRTAQMQQGDVDVREAPRDLPQLVDDEGIASNVDPR